MKRDRRRLGQNEEEKNEKEREERRRTRRRRTRGKTRTRRFFECVAPQAHVIW